MNIWAYLLLIGLAGSFVSMTLMSSLSYLLIFGFFFQSRQIFKQHFWTYVFGGLWIGWVAIGTLGKSLNPQSWDAFTWAVKLLLPLGGLCLLERSPPKNFKNTFYVLFFVAALASLSYAIYQRLYLGMARSTSFHHNAVYLAFNHGILLVSLLSVSQAHTNPILKIFKTLTITVILITIGLSGTRSAWLGLVVFALAKKIQNRSILFEWARKKTHFLLAALIGLVTLIAVSGVGARFWLIFDKGWQSDVSAWGRWEIWKINWEFLKENYISGMGYRQNALILEDYPKLSHILPPGSKQIFAHQQFLQSAVESGLIGALFFLLFLMNLSRSFPGTWGILIFTLSIGLFDAPFTVSRFFYPWIYALVIIGWLNQNSRMKANET